MSRIHAGIRHTISHLRHLKQQAVSLRHWPPAIALIASLLVSALGPPVPAHADPPDPVARIQVVIQKIYVYDDEDWFGNGELRMDTLVCSVYAPSQCRDEAPIVTYHDAISAGSGETVTLNREMPREGDTTYKGAGAEIGIPVYPGQQYLLFVNINEQDVSSIEDMGHVEIPIDEAHGWGIGSSNIRSTHNDGSAGDYALFYEIRRVPLANLRMVNYQVAGVSSAENICGQIQNDGQRPAGPFQLTFRTEGQIVGAINLAGLGAGESTWQCIQRTDLPAHKHYLEFSLDELRQVIESEEYDNIGTYTVEANAIGTTSATGAASTGTSSAPPAAPSPQPKPTGSQPAANDGQSQSGGDKGDKPDPTIRAIRLNGQVPDGKNDCSGGSGKNNVTVVVKNAGKADAASFSVHLDVDGSTLDQTVDTLRAGEQREVAFENVSLKKGEHKLTAAVDATGPAGDAKQSNNTTTVSVRCQG